MSTTLRIAARSHIQLLVIIAPHTCIYLGPTHPAHASHPLIVSCPLQVALHVLRQHQYRPPGDDGRGAAMQETIHDRRLSLDQNPDELNMWLKVDTRLHGAAAESEQQVCRCAVQALQTTQ